MKKTIALLLALIMALGLVLSACGKQADAQSSAEEDSAAKAEQVNNINVTQSDDGTYTWQLSKYSLTTRTNIKDYIDGGSWNVRDMSIDLGLHQAEEYGIVSTKHYFSDTKPIVYLRFISEDNYYGYFHVYTYENGGILSFDVNSVQNGEMEFNYNGEGPDVSFDLIAAYTYACEQLLEDPETDPFAGVIPSDDPSEYQIN